MINNSSHVLPQAQTDIIPSLCSIITATILKDDHKHLQRRNSLLATGWSPLGTNLNERAPPQLCNHLRGQISPRGCKYCIEYRKKERHRLIAV